MSFQGNTFQNNTFQTEDPHSIGGGISPELKDVPIEKVFPYRPIVRMEEDILLEGVCYRTLSECCDISGISYSAYSDDFDMKGMLFSYFDSTVVTEGFLFLPKYSPYDCSLLMEGTVFSVYNFCAEMSGTVINYDTLMDFITSMMLFDD